MIRQASIIGLIIICSGCANVAFGAPAKHATKPAGAPAAQSNSAASAAQDAYLGRLRGKLQHNWFLPDGSNKVVLTASVAADGSVDGVNVSSTPKSDLAEQAASDAFSKAQPLEALPSSAKAGAKLMLEFTSTADPHGDSNSHINTRLEPVQAPKAPAKEPDK